MRDKQFLEQAGVQATESRVEMFKIIKNAKKPIDSATIIEEMQKKSPETNRVTIFRTLNVFVEKGVIIKCEFEEGKARYELSSLPHHHHIVCSNCGKIEDLEGCEISEIESNLEKRFNFKINSHRLEFFGFCKKCK